MKVREKAGNYETGTVVKRCTYTLITHTHTQSTHSSTARRPPIGSNKHHQTAMETRRLLDGGPGSAARLAAQLAAQLAALSRPAAMLASAALFLFSARALRPAREARLLAVTDPYSLGHWT